jgi:chemotaxis protein MotB
VLHIYHGILLKKVFKKVKKLSVTLKICFFILLIISLFFNFSKKNNFVEHKEESDVLFINEGGYHLGKDLREAIITFNEEIKYDQARIVRDERGIVISISSDLLFNSESAIINIEAAHKILNKLATLLLSEEIVGRKLSIEGHTDSTPVDPEGPFVSNWHLSCELALIVMYYLKDLGVSENRIHVVGCGSSVPIVTNDTHKDRTYNRRIEVIIIDDTYWGWY